MEDPHPDEFKDNNWVDTTIVENISAEHNRSSPPTATNDLKAGDIFELDAKLLQAISECSIIAQCHSSLPERIRFVA